MASTTTAHPHAEHSSRRYWIVWIALLFFTFLTFALGRIHIQEPWALVIALAIASTKSLLVVLFFMHLYDHPGANRLVFGVSILLVVTMIALSIGDVSTRFPLLAPPGSTVYNQKLSQGNALRVRDYTGQKQTVVKGSHEAAHGAAAEPGEGAHPPAPEGGAH